MFFLFKDALGDVVYAQLPDIGTEVLKKGKCDSSAEK
jgi:hypothetical protein